MLVRIKKLLVAVFIILILITIYLPEVDDIIYRNPDNLIDELNEEDKDNIITSEDKSLDMDKEEVIFTYIPLSEEIIDRINGISYKENNEVKIEDLAYIQVTHWGFDDRDHMGEMIVNIKVAEEVVEIFRELYEAKFPIEKIKLIDEYDAKDDLSMADNNTSAFCYREVTGSKGKLSNHSYGVAIDINPVQNPYVKDNTILPEGGKEYLDRDNIRKGMIISNDVCYNAFKSRGWTWGGEWNSLKDYQHFEFIIPNSN